MNFKPILYSLVGASLLTFALTFTDTRAQNRPENPDIWISAYMASWNHYAPPTGNWGNLPTSEIDWQAFTHMIYFAFNVRSDGSLSEVAPYENMNPDRLNEITTAGHRNNTPVLFSVGGWGNYEGFSSAIEVSYRTNFINNLINIMTEWDFDGIDLDMEPIRTSDVDNFKAFVQELHAELQNYETPLLDRPLLTAATDWQAEMFAEIQDLFDQINLMTYDYSGAWEGWVSWHNSAVYNGGHTFPGLTRTLPAANKEIDEFIEAGVSREKLGAGLDFYGYVWSGGKGTPTGGVTQPLQIWTNPPQVTDNVAYHQIMNEYHAPSRVRWDSVTQAAYISIDRDADEDDRFISYDNHKTVFHKVDYVREKEIGGLIIWELSGGYLRNESEGKQDSLLQTVKFAAWGNHPSNIDRNPDTEHPREVRLEQNYPNPFNPGTTIAFALPRPTHVELTIYDLTGQKVETLVDKQMEAGNYTVRWNASKWASGTYLYQLTADDMTLTKKLTVIK